MSRRIAVIQGHPDAQARHFGHALADEYAKGDEDGGHEVKRLEVAKLDFPLLRGKGEWLGDMPAFFYRWLLSAHGLKNLQRNILGFSGIGPVRSSLIGTVEGMDDRRRAGWLDRIRALGEAGQ